ncbi:hypothetical protein [Lysobacter gummosus]|uniref:hypothetical protein n=1 Tax=Lysobacter gummosus TaxID=262324 RepID=UPI00362BB48C
MQSYCKDIPKCALPFWRQLRNSEEHRSILSFRPSSTPVKTRRPESEPGASRGDFPWSTTQGDK